VRPSVVTDPNWGRHVDDSFDQLGLLEIRSCQIPAMELLAGQMVASFEGDGSVSVRGHERHLVV
jgi:hypothetical protein